MPNFSMALRRRWTVALSRLSSEASCVTPSSGPFWPRCRRMRRAFCRDLLEPGRVILRRLARARLFVDGELIGTCSPMLEVTARVLGSPLADNFFLTLAAL